MDDYNREVRTYNSKRAHNAPVGDPASQAQPGGQKAELSCGSDRVRKKQGWSQVELGEKSGLSRPSIARVEANNDVTTATNTKVAQALGLKLELRDDG